MRLRPWPLICGLALIASSQVAQRDLTRVEWRHYGGDLASTKYSPLDQINAANLKDLTVAWRWPSPDNDVVKANPQARPGGYEDTPLMVNGVLYTATSLGRLRRSILKPARRSGNTIRRPGK